jgi:hypothetical protein
MFALTLTVQQMGLGRVLAGIPHDPAAILH